MIVENSETLTGSKLMLLEGDQINPSYQRSYSNPSYQRSYSNPSYQRSYLNPSYERSYFNSGNISKLLKEEKDKKIREYLRGIFVEETELLGGDEFDEMSGEELLGYTKSVTREDVAVLPFILEGDHIQTVEDVRKHRQFLRGLLVDHGEFLGGEEFDSMTDEELLGFFKKLWKGIKKGVSSIGKFVGKGIKGIGKVAGKVVKGVGKVAGNIAKGVWKGAGKVIKFVGDNAGGLLKAGLSFLPGGSIISAGIDALTQNQQEQQIQENPAAQNQRLETYPEAVTEYYEPEVSEVMPQADYQEEYYVPETVSQDEYYEPEAVEGLGNLKNLVKKAGNITQWIANPLNQRKIAEYMNANAESQTQRKVLLSQSGLTADQKQKESELRYTTGTGIQNFISTYGLYIVIGLAALLIFMNINNKKS